LSLSCQLSQAHVGVVYLFQHMMTQRWLAHWGCCTSEHVCSSHMLQNVQPTVPDGSALDEAEEGFVVTAAQALDTKSSALSNSQTFSKQCCTLAPWWRCHCWILHWAAPQFLETWQLLERNQKGCCSRAHLHFWRRSASAHSSVGSCTSVTIMQLVCASGHSTKGPTLGV
jgi:hypothetical protein